jgi:allantoate deiminase
MAPTAAEVSFSNADRRLVERWAAELVERLRQHGGSADGGVTRLVYSPAWVAAMVELESWFERAGLDVRADAVGSRFGRLTGTTAGGAVVLTGSHVDSVRDGGAYDGILGVIVAACAVRWLAAEAGRPQRSLEVLANCEEESSRFPCNFWGSRAMLGLIGPEEPERLVDADGMTIAEAMRKCGLDSERIPEARRDEFEAYVEPHIEQGPFLEREGVQLGVVEAIVAVNQLRIELTGEAGHAGTIPMGSRKDALAGAAECILAAEQIATEMGAPAVATVGWIQAGPGGFNQVPGVARFSLDYRHSDPVLLSQLAQHLRRSVAEIAKSRGLHSHVEQPLGQQPIGMDETLKHILDQACDAAGVTHRRIASAAGHDAQLMARRCPAAMLFMPSRAGVSHRPDEFTSIESIGAGIEVLARALSAIAY